MVGLLLLQLEEQRDAVSKTDEFFIKNEELCHYKRGNFVSKMMNFADG